jgi:hypothetical protein
MPFTNSGEFPDNIKFIIECNNYLSLCPLRVFLPAEALAKAGFVFFVVKKRPLQNFANSILRN